MKPEEAIAHLKGMQNKKVDYAEMVCAPGFCSGYEYVYPEPEDYAIEEAVKALKEIQNYRKLGTLEELARAKKYIDLSKRHGTIGEMIDECAEYESIGTVEECREAIEKQKAKKPLLVSKKEKIMEGDYVHVICPTCGEEIFSCFLFYPWNDSQRTHEFCESCGQAIQWDENLEETEDGA